MNAGAKIVSIFGHMKKSPTITEATDSYLRNPFLAGEFKREIAPTSNSLVEAGQVVAMDKWSMVMQRHEKGYVVQYKNEICFLDEKCVAQIPSCINAYPFDKNKEAKIFRDGEWYVINQYYKVISPPFAYIGERACGLRPVKKSQNGNFFYVDESFFPIPGGPEFETATPFSLEGTAVVSNKGVYHFINTDLKPTSENRYQCAVNYRAGIAQVKSATKGYGFVWQYLGQNEKPLFDKVFVTIESFDEGGWAYVREPGGDYYLLHRSGEVNENPKDLFTHVVEYKKRQKAL